MSKEKSVINASKPRNLCSNSEKPTPFEPGTKNPCEVCGRLSTTKRDGTQRRHTAKKIKQEA